MSTAVAPRTPSWRLAAPAVVTVVVLLVFAGRYGFHRDELYFMADADHLAWGYVDHPPLTPVIGMVSQAIFGDTVFGLRVIPALIAGAVVWCTGGVCAELGGDATTRQLASWAVAGSTAVLAMGHMLTTPGADVLAWTVALWLLIRLVRTQDPRWLMAIGAVIGVGLLNKFTMLFAVAAFGGGLLLTPQRRVLASWWTLVGAAIAVAMWAPHLVWQVQHGWPLFEFSRAIADEATENRVLTLPYPFMLLGPPVAVVAAIALWRVARKRVLVPYRFVAYGWAILVLLLLATGGKPYYLAGALPTAAAVGAVWWVQRPGWRRRRTAVVVAINGAVSVLIALPVLPVDTFVGSPAAAVFPEPLEMIGWPEFVDQVAADYAEIDDGSRSAVVFAGNYGEAGAIDRYGGARGLPRAYSGHNSYADFGVPPGSAGPVLVIGFDDPTTWFVGCRALDPIVMPHDIDTEEQGRPVWACDAPVRAWSDLWSDLRHVD